MFYYSTASEEDYDCEHGKKYNSYDAEWNLILNVAYHDQESDQLKYYKGQRRSQL